MTAFVASAVLIRAIARMPDGPLAVEADADGLRLVSDAGRRNSMRRVSILGARVEKPGRVVTDRSQLLRVVKTVGGREVELSATTRRITVSGRQQVQFDASGEEVKRW